MGVRINTVGIAVLAGLAWILLFAGAAPTAMFAAFVSDFTSGYRKLQIPGIAYDYREYFSAVPSAESLLQQDNFFRKQNEQLLAFDRTSLHKKELIQYDHLRYEIDFNRERTRLENAWVADGRMIPARGLYGLPNHGDWYLHFIRKYTGLSIRPEDIMAMGLREVARVQQEIRSIRLKSGMSDSSAFYDQLNSEAFVLRDKAAIGRAFARADSIIRRHLHLFIGSINIPPVYAMEWAGADADTPPGMYLNRQHNAYGKDAFLYNFYSQRYNSRAVDWLYMHEAIPGHHLQATLRTGDSADELQSLFSYPGNFEGWACYVEYHGKELGMYADGYSQLGHCEWDLVRSARLVLDAGIHYYGWSYKRALDYWQKNIPGQDGIADREIMRVTRWPAQALSYKAGAECLMQLRRQMVARYGGQFDQRIFHRAYLSFGMRPLALIRQHLETIYRESVQP